MLKIDKNTVAVWYAPLPALSARYYSTMSYRDGKGYFIWGVLHFNEQGERTESGWRVAQFSMSQTEALKRARMINDIMVEMQKIRMIEILREGKTEREFFDAFMALPGMTIVDVVQLN